MNKNIELIIVCVILVQIGHSIRCDIDQISDRVSTRDNLRKQCWPLIEIASVIGLHRKFSVWDVWIGENRWNLEKIDLATAIAMVLVPEQKKTMLVFKEPSFKWRRPFFEIMFERKFLKPCHRLLTEELVMDHVKRRLTDEQLITLISSCHKMTIKNEAKKIYKKFRDELGTIIYKIID